MSSTEYLLTTHTFPESGSSTSTSSQISVESNISVLALRVVKSILGTVDHKSGKTIGQHLAMHKNLEEEVINLSAKVVKDVSKLTVCRKDVSSTVMNNPLPIVFQVAKVRNLSPETIITGEFAELEEKISKLALNIITTVHEGVFACIRNRN